MATKAVPRSPVKSLKSKVYKQEAWEFALADREQRVVLSGCAAVAVQFSELSGEEFLSLIVNVGEESVPHAILGAGERIRFTCANKHYYVSVLAIDNSERLVRLRIDPEHR